MTYSKVNLESLIKRLEQLKEKGVTEVYIDGTLYTKEKNDILASNEPQI